MFKHPFVCIATTRTTSMLKKNKPSCHLNEALLPIYPVSTSNHFAFIVSFSIFLYSFISASFSDVSIATLSARAMERLNTLNGDSFQPFRGLSELWHSKCFCFFLFFFFRFFSFFSCTIFFQPGTSTCVWWVCHCGPPSLFVYHSLLQATVTTQSCWQSTGNAFLTMTAILPPRPRRLSSVASLSCVSSSLSAIGLAAGALQCSVPSQRVGFWRIVSSHFVLGEVSNGPWKDGSHLSPCWLWPMVTYLQYGSDGPRPAC